MSLYNDIIRRPHLPREPSIRRIMSETNIDLSLYGRSSEDLEGEENEEALVAETEDEGIEVEEEGGESDPEPASPDVEVEVEPNSY